MSVYGIDIKLVATLNVKAKNRAKAIAKALNFLENTNFVFSADFISEVPFDHHSLPDVSLAETMTQHGFCEDPPCLEKK